MKKKKKKQPWMRCNECCCGVKGCANRCRREDGHADDDHRCNVCVARGRAARAAVPTVVDLGLELVDYERKPVRRDELDGWSRVPVAGGRPMMSTPLATLQAQGFNRTPPLGFFDDFKTSDWTTYLGPRAFSAWVLPPDPLKPWILPPDPLEP